ncbi:MAG: fumarylacetoacetase [Candidatus Eremiobacterota bacterium]
MSWFPAPSDSDFTLANLPYGVFRPAGASPRVGVALGELVVDLARLGELGHLEPDVFGHDCLNPFMELGPTAWRWVRSRLQALLQTPPDDSALHRQTEVELLLPIRPADYVDFYSSLEHATNVGTMFRGPANALNPNWRHIPIGYHGRAGSLVVSGTDVRRPHGQLKPGDDPPVFGPSRQLDFELEMAFVVGVPSPLGTVVPVARAEEHVFGLFLLNDWSARDIQKWEYVPLGPFLGKSFATTASPWVVPLEALEPFRLAGPEQDPAPLDYLRSARPGNFDIRLEVWLEPPGGSAVRIAHSNTRYLYWSMAQQLAHLSSNGSPLRVGDVCASGTISGPEKDQRGSLLELSWGGKEPLELPDGSTRSFLETGDTVTFRAWAGEGSSRVGFGEARGRVV